MTHKFFSVLVLLTALVCAEKARSASIVLDWSASASPTVAGYVVYYGSTSGNYTYSVNAGDATSVTIPNLAPGVTYYFAASAYDIYGDQSGLSSEISYTAPMPAPSAPPNGLSVSLASGANSTALVQFPVQSGHWYELYATSDLAAAGNNLAKWTRIWHTGMITANTSLQFPDTDAAQCACRFYQLIAH